MYACPVDSSLSLSLKYKTDIFEAFFSLIAVMYPLTLLEKIMFNKIKILLSDYFLQWFMTMSKIKTVGSTLNKENRQI